MTPSPNHISDEPDTEAFVAAVKRGLASADGGGRVKRGRTKIITVTPEGAFRGDVNRHAAAVNRYKGEVVPLRPVPAE